MNRQVNRCIVLIVIASISIIFHGGCAVVATAGLGAATGLNDTGRAFQGTDVIRLDKPYEDVLDVIVDTGKSIGYTVTYLSKENRTVGFTSKGSKLEKLLFFSKLNNIDFLFQVADGGKEVNITFSSQGHKSGKQEKVMEKLNEFKYKLSEHLK